MPTDNRQNPLERQNSPERRSLPERSIQSEIVTACRVLEAAGQADMVWGHVSIRDPEGRGAVVLGLDSGRSAYEVSGARSWDGSLSAQQSARWVVAAVLEDRDRWLEQSSPGWIEDDVLSVFARDRISVEVAPDLGQASVRLHAVLGTGGVGKGLLADELISQLQVAAGERPARPLIRRLGGDA